MNRLSKVTGTMLGRWAEILRRVGNSRLMVLVEGPGGAGSPRLCTPRREPSWMSAGRNHFQNPENFPQLLNWENSGHRTSLEFEKIRTAGNCSPSYLIEQFWAIVEKWAPVRGRK